MKLHCPVRAIVEQQVTNQVIFEMLWTILMRIVFSGCICISHKYQHTLKTANKTSQIQNIPIISFLCGLFTACWWLSFNTPHCPPKENDCTGMCVYRKYQPAHQLSKATAVHVGLIASFCEGMEEMFTGAHHRSKLSRPPTHWQVSFSFYKQTCLNWWLV